MRTIWFTIQKDKLNYFIDVATKMVVSPEDIIIRIKNSDETTITSFIKEGYLDESDEWALFDNNWNKNKYLLKLSYDDSNDYYNIEMLNNADRKAYREEIEDVNNRLKVVGERFSKIIENENTTSNKLFIDYETFLEITDKLVHQRLINLLIEYDVEYFKKDKGFVLIKECYWDLPIQIQYFFEKEENAKYIKWI